MVTSETLARIARMEADHYRSSEEFQRQQAEAVAECLREIIDIVGFKPGPPYDYPLFESFYSVPRLLDHIRAIPGAADKLGEAMG